MNTIIKTLDGSSTVYSKRFNEHYHSTFGAIQESMHVFIESGLQYSNLKSLKIFEVGFGTGLNAFLTLIESIHKNLTVEYTSVELYPLNIEIINNLNFNELYPTNLYSFFIQLHSSKWNIKTEINKNFCLLKLNEDFVNYKFTEKYDLIFFDAFAPEKQPKMWSLQNFRKIYDTLNHHGILTTYSSKGIVKKNLREAGFEITRLKGPVGKRHILRAEKL